MEKFNSIADLLRHLETYSNPMALNELVEGKWKSTSSHELVENVKAIALWLGKIGLKQGDKVGILAVPSPQWTLIDLGCTAAGLVVVPLFANISEENFIFECTQTELKTLFVSGEDQWVMWSKHKGLFTRTIALDNSPAPGETYSYQKMIEEGTAEVQKRPEVYYSLLEQVKPTDVASIIFTSGSTGTPKGVVLTHLNLVANAHINSGEWSGENDRYLSILPLAHIFARVVNYINLAWGVSIYYFNDVKNIGPLCKELHPTIISVVPRLLEKIYAKMVGGVETAGFLKRTIGHWAFSLANDEHEGIYKTLMHPLADKIVYSHLREALGGALRIVISGGATLDVHLCHFFIDIGVPIYEGYGLTESCVVSSNDPKNRKIGTVGKITGTTQVKIAPNGEILIKGDIVFSGYYLNPKSTQEAIDPEGWFHTGDRGKIDDEGYLTIIGRLKDLVKTSVGEYIAPVPIEQQLSRAPFVDLAMLVIEGRKFVSCLIFPNFEVVKKLKKAENQENVSDETFLQSDYIKHEMDKLIGSINEHVNQWEQIRAYRFVTTPPSIEGGELTPSMKIRREVIAKKYKPLIDAMYTEDV